MSATPFSLLSIALACSSKEPRKKYHMEEGKLFWECLAFVGYNLEETTLLISTAKTQSTCRVSGEFTMTTNGTRVERA